MKTENHDLDKLMKRIVFVCCMWHAGVFLIFLVGIIISCLFGIP